MFKTKKVQLTKTMVYMAFSAVTIFISIVFFILNLNNFKAQIFNNYSQSQVILNKNQLNTYQKSNLITISNFYSNALGTIENMVSSQTVTSALASNNSSTLNTIFEQERTFNQDFDSILAYNSADQLIALSSDKHIAFSNVPTNRIELKAINEHRILILPGLKSLSNRLVIGFVVPVNNSSGQYTGSIVANISLSLLSQQLNLLSTDNTFSTILVDANYNLLERDSSPAQTLINLKDREPILGSLKTNGLIVYKNETNYLGQKVLAEGSLLKFKNYGQVYIISFKKQSAVSAGVNNFMAVFRGYYRSFLALNLLIILLLSVVCYYCLRRIVALKNKKHDKNQQKT